MTPIGLGRRPDGMRAVADATGLTVIAASGYHRDAHYPAGHWVHDATVETLADRIVTDLTTGMHPADWNDPSLPLDPARAGAIKGGASYHRISRSERRRLEAIAGASAQTGAAILVHTEIGTAGHDSSTSSRRPARRRTGSPSPTSTATRTGSSTPRSPHVA